MFFVHGLLYAIKKAKKPRRDSTAHQCQYPLHGEVVIFNQLLDTGGNRERA